MSRMKNIVKTPNGSAIIDKEKKIAKPARSWVNCVGKYNAREMPLPKGIWLGSYQMKRGERVLIHLEGEVVAE